ncbi:glucose-1-phosphate adenylyltransferase [Kordiimonas sp. A6E486]|nr:glucose-1-phosphate adenylyltransferase [Kordiimonas marina]
MHRLSGNLDHALKHTLALVLAGGKGTRLKDLGATDAKPALPFGGTYRLIDFPLSNCLNSGIRKIGVATQYRAQGLHRHLQEGWSFLSPHLGEFVAAWPAEQASSDGIGYKGTADAVYQNLDAIRAHGAKHVLILAGDHVYKQDYGLMLAEHLQKGADVTVSCVEVPTGEASGFGIVATDAAGNITDFVEKPAHPPAMPDNPLHALASMGIYIFRADFLAEVLAEDAARESSGHDFGHDILPALIGRAKIIAHRFGDSCAGAVPGEAPYWRDVGTLDSYWQANLDLAGGHPALDLFDPDWPVRSSYQARPPARFDIGIGCRGSVAHTVAAPGVTVAGATVKDTLLSQDVTVGMNARLDGCVLLPGVQVGANACLKRVIVAAGCKIPDGFVAGEDITEDARWFTRTPDGIALITQDALDRRAISRKLVRARPYHMPPVGQTEHYSARALPVPFSLRQADPLTTNN